ncbi:restriction endonuclease subunit S [Dyadobacter psychrophilus]|uniref:Type I restriction modification DNA specificity domain-containing protein n=1 Tax=Dyadobacter psychrophilus TaxID=651661 RepID=A0A1T5BX10_9BACT|nr:restriction endonuclease subunit S [Dyadobacter psychrophilus]SKB51681.1 Type I restriction modification DNA specificity domain-containing protein [Dyadobacter psychrophilus]
MSVQLFESTRYFDLQDCEAVELGAVANITTGCQYPQFEWADEDLQPFPLIEKIIGGNIMLGEPRFMRISERDKRKFGFRHGDIIFIHNSSPVQLGKCVLFDLPEFVLHTKYLRMVANEHLSGKFLLLMLNKLRSEGRFRSIAKQRGHVSYMTIDDLKKLKIPVPTIEEQKQLLKTFENPLHLSAI